MKMNRMQIFGFMILGLLLFTASSGFVAASDNDDDGVDDKVEEDEQRDLGVKIEENKIEVESVLSTGSQLNKIKFEITNDSDGVKFGIEFEPSYIPDSNNSNIELEFTVHFKAIVEYIDENANGVYDELIDTELQTLELNTFEKTEHSIVNISSNTQAHYFKISTSDGIFSVHAFFVEEFEIVNNTLVTPMETKLDIEIKNFNYLNDSSYLALYTNLQSESDYESVDHTEDEKNSYDSNEKGVITSMNSQVGFFTWKENASIDGISTAVHTSQVLDDSSEIDEQKIYFNYAHGANIYHDPKIGVETITTVLPSIPGYIPIVLLTTITIGIIASFVIFEKRKKR